MAAPNQLIMNLLRIITPEEIADIATKHNGGKFLSLTDLVNERVERKIYRDFTSTSSMDEIHEQHAIQHNESEQTAKILPFKTDDPKEELQLQHDLTAQPPYVTQSIVTSQAVPHYTQEHSVETVQVEHKEDENMSTFIMIEKARLHKSQKISQAKRNYKSLSEKFRDRC